MSHNSLGTSYCRIPAKRTGISRKTSAFIVGRNGADREVPACFARGGTGRYGTLNVNQFPNQPVSIFSDFWLEYIQDHTYRIKNNKSNHLASLLCFPLFVIFPFCGERWEDNLRGWYSQGILPCAVLNRKKRLGIFKGLLKYFLHQTVSESAFPFQATQNVRSAESET